LVVLIIALILVAVVALFALATRRTTKPDLTNQAIATALGRLVRDRAVVVEGGYVSTTQLDDRRSTRGRLEARTLATVRVSGTIPIERLFTAVREARL
jgi:hypothetical protein